MWETIFSSTFGFSFRPWKITCSSSCRRVSTWFSSGSAVLIHSSLAPGIIIPAVLGSTIGLSAA